MSQEHNPVPVVIDTSVLAKWFLPEPLSSRAQMVLDEAREGLLRMVSPDLIVYEFANILWQRQKKGEIVGAQAQEIMSDFDRLPISLAPADIIGAEALRIANKVGCTAYDGACAALALGLKTYVLTADNRFVKSMREAGYHKYAIALSAWEKQRNR